MPDAIIEELWQIKDSMAREHGYDIDAFVAHLQSRKRGVDRHVFDLHAMKEAAERTASTEPHSYTDSVLLRMIPRLLDRSCRLSRFGV